MNLKKVFRIKKSDEIEALIKTRNVVSNKYFKLYCRKNHDAKYFRFALSVPKKYGKAHERNLMKRRLRMIISSLPIKHHHEFFIIVSPYAKTLSFAEIKTSIEYVLMKKNLLEVENETV